MKDLNNVDGELMLTCLELAKENSDTLWINLMEELNKSPDKSYPEDFKPLIVPIYNKYKNQAFLVKLKNKRYKK